MMRAEWLGRGAASNRLQNWRFDFQKTAIFEEAPCFADDRDALFEHLAGVLVGEKIEVTLSIPRLDVL